MRTHPANHVEQVFLVRLFAGALAFGVSAGCALVVPDVDPGTATSGDAGSTTPPAADASAPPDAGPVGPAKPQSFTLTSDVGGSDIPFTVGLAFGKGDVPSGFTLDAASVQVDVKRRWDDGSVKHAIVSGTTTLTNGTAKTLMVVSGAPSAGTPLSCADIKKAAPAATVSLGTSGSVSLATLLDGPVRTWLAGPEAVECHYRGAAGAELRVSFHVRLYRTGRVFVRTVVENGWLDRATNASYVPVVRVGGATVFDNGGAALTHYGHTRWAAEGWIGGDPKVVARHDTSALIGSRLVPNYWQKAAASSALDGLHQTYAPMTNAGWTVDMGQTGFQHQIGLLPHWDALYLTSQADPRALRAVVAQSLALGSYPIVWRDPTTDLPVLPSKRPMWTVRGENGGGSDAWSAGPYRWEVAHHGSAGYLAYLITGDYVHLETMQLQAALAYLVDWEAHGPGTSRVLGGQTRGLAWSTRTIGQLAGIGPVDGITEDYAALLANNATALDATRATLPGSAIGVLYSYDLGTASHGPGNIAPWQQHFLDQTYGHVSDLEPIADMTTFRRVRDFLYRFPVGILGAGGAGSFCFTQAGSYTLKVAPQATGDLRTLYDWGGVFTQNFGSATCGNALLGSSGGDPKNAAEGFWGNLLPAIAYAVDHGAPGAVAAWARLTGATNWSDVGSSGFDNVSIWGVVPRTK